MTKITVEHEEFILHIEDVYHEDCTNLWKASCPELSDFSGCFSPGYYTSLDMAVSTFKKEIARSKEKKIPKVKLDKENYECRTGHLVCSCNSDYLELRKPTSYSFVIVKKDFPRITRVDELLAGFRLHILGDVSLRLEKDGTFLGHGRTEEEAWNMFEALD